MMTKADRRRAQAAKRKRVTAERTRLRLEDRAVRHKLIVVKLPQGVHPGWYAEYLKTPHWKAFKQRYRQSDRLQWCVVCCDPKYELHHRSYDHIGAEQLDDVVALCRAHHARAHRNVKDGAALWNAHL
jgi:hypothetical protein